MKAEEKRFLQFLEGSEKSFVIPVYQRNYDWKQEQCKQLFNDIIQITKENFRTHFLGSIVAYQEDWYWKELLIIDGQQRLTTISLLLLALYKVLDNWEIESNIIKQQIYDEFLINKYSKDKTKKIRLKPVKDDREAFNSIFEWDRIEDSNVTINFDYFYNRLLEKEIIIEDFYKAIKQLIIVEIMLKKWEDDAQLIFESLNSTWLDLTEADKVRNFILMKENSEKQEYLYKNYWYKIEKNTNYKVSEFLRDYLTFRTRKIPKKSNVYVEFKNYIIKNNFDIEELLKELLIFSQYYKNIINSNDEDKNISKVLKRINKLETIVVYPFFLYLYSKLDENIITKDEFYKILLIIESYVFRRFICWVPTSALNKTFMLLWKEIENFKDYKDNFFELFKYILLNKDWSQRFPKNEEFSEYLKLKDIYNTQSRNKLHLLERLENFDNREADIENLIDDWTLTIEHIMPQTLTPEWERELWEKAKKIYEKYLHTLWNITLTWYNSKYSNKSFEEKKNMEKWFKESHLYLNWFLKKIDIWNEENILNRYNILKEKALKVWELPKTDYKEKRDETKIFTLSDDKDFKGEDILEYDFDWKTYKVNNWYLFFTNIVKILYNKDKLLMKSFVWNDDYLWSKFFTEKLNENTYYEKIDDNFFLKINYWTQWKINLIKELFEKYNISLDDLVLYIK